MAFFRKEKGLKRSPYFMMFSRMRRKLAAARMMNTSVTTPAQGEGEKASSAPAGSAETGVA